MANSLRERYPKQARRADAAAEATRKALSKEVAEEAAETYESYSREDLYAEIQARDMAGYSSATVSEMRKALVDDDVANTTA